MDNKQIEDLLLAAIPLQAVYVTGDKKHLTIIAVGNIFETLTPVKKQQTVYAPLMELIAQQQLHAISIKTYTPEEWKRQQKLINTP